MTDDFESLIERQRESEPRIHVDLTDSFKQRLSQILRGVPKGGRREAFNRLFELKGYEPADKFMEVESPEKVTRYVERDCDEAHTKFTINAETELVLTYAELAMKKHQSEFGIESMIGSEMPKSVDEVANSIQEALESECILWELKNDDSGVYRFEQMGSEAMQEADEEVRGLMQGTVWEVPLRGYNEAYELYQDRKYGKEIPEKLYNSIEAVVQKICVNLEGWEDNEDRNLKHYLDILREKEVFAPNPIMKAEVGDLVDSMERAFNKAGNDRKNRHELIDRRYCTLMLHQVSAYLVFIIKRYEDEYNS